MNAASEENIPISSLRLVGRPTEKQMPQSHIGGGDVGDKGMLLNSFFFMTMICCFQIS